MNDVPWRVLDLTDELGHQTARMMVGIGADVVRPVVDDVDPADPRALHWHAGKRVVRLADHHSMETFISDALSSVDVVLESGPVDSLRTLELRERHPDDWAPVVHTVITPFGLSGPRRRWRTDDTVLAAAGGMAWLGGDPGRAPEPPPCAQATQVTGVHGALGTLLALLVRRRTGQGQLVEVSGQEAVASTLETGAIAAIHGAPVPGRTSGVYGHVAHRVFATADGYVAGGYSGSPRMWDDLLAWMVQDGEAEDLGDEAWRDPAFRWSERPHVDAVVARFVARRKTKEFAIEARRRALPWAEVATAEALRHNEQLAARGFFVTLGDPGHLTDVGFGWESPALPRPVRLGVPRTVRSGTPWPDGRRHVPVDGPDVDAVDAPALQGLRVLDLTWVLAGPYATRTLGDHGADIIKVESHHRKDPTRFSPGMRLRPDAGINDGGYFLNFNRNKRSLALNLRTEHGQELLRRLVPTVDVVVENFSPGVLDRWGLDFTSLQRLNPGIILVSMAGVGHSGPWRDAVTFADTLAAMSGLTSATAREDRAPQGLTFGLGDMIAANMAVGGTLELLLRGEGGHVDLSQLEAMASQLGPVVLAEQVPSQPDDSLPAAVLRAAGDDRWIAVGRTPPGQLAAALGAMRVPVRSDHPLEDLARVAEQSSADQLASDLQAVGIAAHPVRDGRDLVENDPQLASRSFFTELSHPLTGPVLHDGLAVHLSETPATLRNPAPLLGQHTDEILEELLGLTSDELAALHAEGVLT